MPYMQLGSGSLVPLMGNTICSSSSPQSNEWGGRRNLSKTGWRSRKAYSNFIWIKSVSVSVSQAINPYHS